MRTVSDTREGQASGNQMFADKSSSFSTRKINKRPSFEPNALSRDKDCSARVLLRSRSEDFEFSSSFFESKPGNCVAQKNVRNRVFIRISENFKFWHPKIMPRLFMRASLIKYKITHPFSYRFSREEIKTDSLNKKIIQECREIKK